VNARLDFAVRALEHFGIQRERRRQAEQFEVARRR
jgi:hypothetical protein